MARQPDPIPGLIKRIEKLENDARRQRNSSQYTNTGMAPDGFGGVQSDDFDGDLSNADAGTTGWAMNAQRAAFGELILRPGSIGNDALTNPVVPQYIYDYTSNFGVGTTMSHIRRTSITVPAGVTSAVVSVVGRIYAVNDTPNLDYLYCQTNVAGFNGIALPAPATGSNGSCTNISPFATTLSGLTPGSTFTVDIDAQVAAAPWSVNVYNQCDVAGTILWFR